MHPRNRGVFSISVVEELTGVSQQNLRAYEARGLVKPSRTRGGTRRYSQDDVDRINEIAALLETGVNHEGALRVMEVRAEVDSLRRQLETLSDQAEPPASPGVVGPVDHAADLPPEHGVDQPAR